MTSSSYEPYFSLYRRGYTDPSPRVTVRSRLTYGSYAAPPRGPGLLGRTAASPELDLSRASQVSSEFRAVRTQEKAQLQELNDRFAGFIEHVRDLEQRNRALQAELLALQRRHGEPSRLRALYEQEVRDLRSAVEEARAESQAAHGRRDRLEQELQGLQARYEEEALAREEAEGRLLETRRGMDEAALTRVELEKRADTLLDELAFLKRVHEGEISELQAQCSARAFVRAEVEVVGPDLTAALRDIRAQYERLAQRNMQSAEEWFHSKAGALAESAVRHGDAARTAKDEAGDCRRQLQELILEIDACKGINQALERQLQETEEKQSGEITAMQDSIRHLEEELRATKDEMARHLREYQDLLNVKMALDIEIAAYRKLLEGEETRFGVGMVHTLAPAPSYTRSLFTPLHTLDTSAPYLLTTRLPSVTELIGARTAQHAEASLAEQAPEKEEEEEKGEEEAAEEGAEDEGEAEEEGQEEKDAEIKEEKEGTVKEEEKNEEEEDGGTEEEENKGGEQDEEKYEETEKGEAGGDEEEEKEKEVKGEETGEDEGERAEKGGDADQAAPTTGKDEGERAEKGGDADQAAPTTGKDEGERAEKGGDADQVAPTTGKDEGERAEKGGDTDQAAPTTGEDEGERAEKGGDADQAAPTTGEDEGERAEKGGDADQAAPTTGEEEKKKVEEKKMNKENAREEEKPKDKKE